MIELSVQQHLLPPVIFVAMLAIGMELRVAQFVVLAARPQAPILGTVIHTLTFPTLAVAAITLTHLLGLRPDEAAALGILLIAAAPSGGFSNVLTMIARANLPLSITLTAVSSVGSVLTVPLLLGVLGLLAPELRGPVTVPIGQILLQLGVLVLSPVALGIVFAERTRWATTTRVKRLQGRTQLLLYLTVALLIAESFDEVAAGFLAALPWATGLCIGNLALGFAASRLVGLSPVDAVTVALEGTARNLGVAILIAANTLERMDAAVFPTVYFLTMLLCTILFARYWRQIPGLTGPTT